MVAFSRLALVIAGAGFSTAQSFSGPPPSGVVPSGVAFPTGGFPGGPGEEGHEHGGDHSGFPYPTGGFHPHGPKPSGTAVLGAQRAQVSGEAPFPSGTDFPAFPSGAARPSGRPGHHGKGGKGGHHSGRPSGMPSALPSLAERAVASDSSLPPKPTGARPSGAPPSGARPTGARPSGARPPMASGSPPPLPSGIPTGVRPSGPPPSGKPTAAPSFGKQSTFVTSVTRKI